METKMSFAEWGYRIITDVIMFFITVPIFIAYCLIAFIFSVLNSFHWSNFNGLDISPLIDKLDEPVQRMVYNNAFLVVLYRVIGIFTAQLSILFDNLKNLKTTKW